MLEEIIESQSKTAVLALMLLSLNRGFSVKELSIKCRIPEKKLTPILKAFENISLLKSYVQAKVRFFFINENHKLLPPIRDSVMSTQKHYEDDLATVLKKLGAFKGVFLTGVFCGVPTSPIDILFVGKPNQIKLTAFTENYFKVLGIELNYTVMDLDEFLVRRNTFDRFIKDIFDYKHVVVLDNTHKNKAVSA